MQRDRALVPVIIAVAMLALAGCTDSNGPSKGPVNGLPALIVSSPVRAAAGAAASTYAAASSETTVYVSLPPATVPDGITATILDQASGLSITTGLADGGFDPVAVTANVGDTLRVVISRAGSAGSITGYQVVSLSLAPRVVRTSPPKGKADVPINAVIVVVFSAPIDSATLNTNSIRLWHGSTPVAGTVGVSDLAGIRAEFHPDSLLASLTAYQLVVTTAIRDVNGLPLDSGVTVPFTSGSRMPADNLVFSTVSAGAYHSCGLVTTGAAYCWGDNSAGALGDGTTASSETPVLVAGGHAFANLSAASSHTCGVTTDGAAYCWGNSPFTLGDGSTIQSSTPVAVAGGLTWAALSAGYNHFCGITTAGAAYCWGNNFSGELGVDSATIHATRSSGPTPFCSPLTCRSAAYVPLPVAGGITFTAIAADGPYSCGIAASGAAYCWGRNTYGSLGTGSAIGPQTCTRQGEEDPYYSSFACSTVPVAVAGGLTFRGITAALGSVCGLTVSGAAYCWGLAPYSQHIDGSNDGLDLCGGPASPCSVNPLEFGGGRVFASLDGSFGHVCGVTGAGDAYCWGLDNVAPGDGADSASLAPVLVTGGLQFKSVSAGSWWNHTCGVTISGVAYCWGDNSYGQLGDQTTKARPQPAKVWGQP